MEDRLTWNPDMELMPEEDMAKIQWEKLKKTLDFVYEKSPFYRKKFEELNLHPKDIRSFEDFSLKVPVTTKEELREMQSKGYPLGDNMTVNMSDIVWVTASTGTTGKPTYTCCTSNDWHMWMESITRTMWLGGLRPWDVHFHALALSTWISGISFTQAARELGATVIPVGVPTPAQRMLMLADDMKPTSIVCTPSYAEHLALRVKEVLGIEPAELGIRKFLCGGEPGAGIPSVKERIEKIWNCDLRDLWGSPEMIAGDKVECHIKQGMHIVNREYCYNEICDPETKEPLKLEDGVSGTFIYTSLGKEAGPLLRFDVQDQVKVWTTPCECGYPGIRVTVTGRYDDMMKIKGVKIWPSTIKDIVAAMTPRLTGQFKMVLSQKPISFRVEGPIRLKAEYGEEVQESELPKLKDELSQRIRDATLWAPEHIDLVPPGTIPAPEFKASYLEIKE